MKDTHNLSEFRISTRARQIVAIATLLVSATLTGPPRLWGQCQQGIAGISLDRGSIIAMAPGPAGNAAGTLRLNCPDTMNYYIVYIYTYSGGIELGAEQLCYLGQTVCSFGVGWNQALQAPMTLTLVGNIWPLGIWGGSASILVLPNGTSSESAANLGVCPSGASCVAGSPINLTNGNTWIQQHDYSVPGLGGGLQLSRVWNSRWAYATPPTLAGMFGSGWRSTYEEMLAGPDSNNNMTYWRGDGGGWTFTFNSTLNTYTLSSPPDVRAGLVPNLTGGFTLTLADGTQRVFNSQNQLAAVIDRNNNQTTLTYDNSNRLATVTSPGGSTLAFTYGDSNNPTQATTVQDSVGTVATYTYDSSSRLTLVSYPDGSALNFTYDPNSSMILSVTDVQGKLLEAHTYDSQNRGLTSTRANGVDSVSLVY
ncbi:MAG: DUF6531 domain-containing protein [Terriglobia bacterium]